MIDKEKSMKNMPLMLKTAFVAMIFAVIAFAVPLSVYADPVTITFDSPPATGFLPGIYAPNSYGSLGVSLTSGSAPNVGYGGFGIGSSSRAISAPNIAFGRDPFAFAPFLRGAFFIPGTLISSSTLARTDFLSLYVAGTQPGQAISWTVSIYGANDPISGSNTLLDSVTGTTDTLVIFSRSITDIGSFVFHGPSLEGIDNLSFNTPTQGFNTPTQTAPAPVPEPATMLLLGSGLVGIGAIARKRRRATSSSSQA